MPEPLPVTSPSCARETAVDAFMLAQTILKPHPAVQSTTMDGETVLLALDTGRYYTLNRLGTAIWDRCNGHATMRAIHAALCDRFEVSPDRALNDLVALANQLVQEGLLQQERR
jgi:coenzyme PQQ synthesis protein D (PqqD)